MTGLLSDDGFIYQRKVTIYHTIEELIKGNLAECKIELDLIANSDINVTYSLDFFIKTNNNKHKYFEVKKREALHLKSELKPVIDRFHQIHNSKAQEDSEYILVYSSQTKGQYLEKLSAASPKIKRLAIGKILGYYVSDDFSAKVICKQMLDDTDPNTKMSNVELQTIQMLDQILKRYNIQKYRIADQVYHAIRVCFEAMISEASNRLKNKIKSGNQTFPIKEAVEIPLESLINYSQSIIDKISRLPRFSNRDEAIRDFHTKFILPTIPVRLRL